MDFSFQGKNRIFQSWSVQFFCKVVKIKNQPGEVALLCNPSFWEARTVGWLELERPLPIDRWYSVAALRLAAYRLGQKGTKDAWCRESPVVALYQSLPRGKGFESQAE
jgi:hypothetical protein